MDRATRCVRGWRVLRERDAAALPQVVEDVPQVVEDVPQVVEDVPQVVEDVPPARRYFSDGFNVYPALMYKDSRGPRGERVPGIHAVAPGKSQTFSVEGDNAELRHYLARLDYLARLGRRSPCFSRCLWALARSVALFVYAWNRRQTFKRQFPKLPAHVCDFVADLI